MRTRNNDKKPSADGTSDNNVSDTRPPPDYDPPETKPVRDNAHPPFGANNTAVLKHGGYSRRMRYTDDINEDAQALRLQDELILVRKTEVRTGILVAKREVARSVDTEKAISERQRIGIQTRGIHRKGCFLAGV